MAKPGKTGLARLFDATRYSMQGFKAGLKHEAALRQELVLAVLLTLMALFLASGALEFLLLVTFPWLVFAFEIVNSAIEAVVDRMGDEYNELSGRAKDLGSACVFVLLCLTALVWLVIIGAHLELWSL